MIRFFSAAFGDNYYRVAQGLLRSFHYYSPRADISIFTDKSTEFQHGKTFRINFADLISKLDEFHRANSGQLRNAFKFLLFKEMRRQYPDDDLCWIDADMLVFTDLQHHLVCGSINVMAHGRRDTEELNLGGGLLVRGDRYAIGGLYSLPPGGALDYLFDVSRLRSEWRDVDRLVQFSGDQLALNHLVARSGLPVNWLSDNKKYIYNLEFGANIHPILGDTALAAITLTNLIPTRDERVFALFCWVKNKYDAHLADKFSTFKPQVANLLMRLYCEDLSRQ